MTVTETTERTGRAPAFADALRTLSEAAQRIAKDVEGKPLFDFGPGLAPITEALAMITSPSPLLGLIVGGPKVGKTNLLLSLALGLVEHTPRAAVALVSAEVPAKPLRARLLCAQIARRGERGDDTGLPIRLGDLAPTGRGMRSMARKRLDEAAAELERHTGRMFILDRERLPGGAIEPEALDRALRDLQPRLAPGAALVILLDYDAYLEVSASAEGIARDEARLRILRDLANRHGALVLTPHQARKGGVGGGWNTGGFEATKGSGEFVYASDLVLHLKSRREEGDEGTHLIRADLLNRHGPGGEFFLEAHHDQAHLRVIADPDEARGRWEAAKGSAGVPKTPGPDPEVVERVLARIDAAVNEARGSYMGAVRVLGLEETDTNRIAIRRAYQLHQIPERLCFQILERCSD